MSRIPGQTIESENVWRLYDKAAAAFDRERSKSKVERKYLDKVLAFLPAAGGRLLDLGCGTGDPIARYFIARGHAVTGIDAAPAMLALARTRFPTQEWIVADMRGLALGRRFDALLAWDSFFHLRAADQRAMFRIFGDHVSPGGTLLFTSGPGSGEAIGRFHGQALYHASLDAAEYRVLLGDAGFFVLDHVVQDPECGGHTVWLARRRS